MAELNVLTYNLRYDNKSDGINSFTNRKEFVKERLEHYKPDLIGFQEICGSMADWVKENLKEYTFIGCGRDADLSGENSPIVFRTEMFTVINSEVFWLSDTPYIPGSHFNTDQSGCNRICTCATMQHNPSGRFFRFYNTHLDHIGEFAKVQGLTVILNKMMENNGNLPLPVIFTGDFNSTPDTLLYKSVTEFNGIQMNDVTRSIENTFHCFGKSDENQKIDYIFTNMKCDISRTKVITDKKGGLFMSDHYPVQAFIEI